MTPDGLEILREHAPNEWREPTVEEYEAERDLADWHEWLEEQEAPDTEERDRQSEISYARYVGAL